MNIFQKQLVMGGKSLAELPDLEGKRYLRPLTPPAKVSIEEFESMRKCEYARCEKDRTCFHYCHEHHELVCRKMMAEGEYRE